MKKSYILMAAALLAAGSIQAAGLKFQAKVGSEFVDIEPNSTYNFSECELDADYEDFVMDPHIHLLSDQTANDVIVIADADRTIQLCAGGNCEMNKHVEKTGVQVEAGVPLNIRFEYTGYAASLEEVKPTTATLSAQYGSDSDSLTEFTIVMDPNNSAVTIIRNDSALRYANGILAYNIEGNATLELFGTNGAVALRTRVSGNGTLSTANIPAGIYAYKLGNKSGKIYIK